MKYRINLILQLRLNEQRDKKQQSTVRILTFVAFALLILAIGYSVSNILKMRLTIAGEQRELARIEAEYRKYKATRMIVGKADIELLDQLQNGRIFWTKKLAAMAFHLPNKPPNPYWIIQFGYDRNILNVKGFGFISLKQEQLITIDDYLNDLRADTNFAEIFPDCYLNSTKRDDEGYRERVTFDYSAEKAGVR